MLLIPQGGEKGTKPRPQLATEHRNDESDGAHLRLSYLNALTYQHSASLLFSHRCAIPTFAAAVALSAYYGAMRGRVTTFVV